MVLLYLLCSVLQIKQTWKEAPLEKGKFNYNEFVSILKGKQEGEQAA